MQRSSVLLPLPLGPMIVSTSPLRDLEVDPAQHLVVAEALVDGLQAYDGLRRCRRDRALSRRHHS